MARKSVMPTPMDCICTPVKTPPMTQPDRSYPWSELNTKQHDLRNEQRDRLYAPPAGAPAVSMVPGAKNSWDK